MDDDKQNLIEIDSDGKPALLPIHNTIRKRYRQRIVEHLLRRVESNAMLASVGSVLVDIPVEPHRFRLPIDNDPS